MIWIFFWTQAVSKPWIIMEYIIAKKNGNWNSCRSGPKIMNQTVHWDTSTDQKQIDSMLIEGCGFVRGSPQDTVTAEDTTGAGPLPHDEWAPPWGHMQGAGWVAWPQDHEGKPRAAGSGKGQGEPYRCRERHPPLVGDAKPPHPWGRNLRAEVEDRLPGRWRGRRIAGKVGIRHRRKVEKAPLRRGEVAGRSSGAPSGVASCPQRRRFDAKAGRVWRCALVWEQKTRGVGEKSTWLWDRGERCMLVGRFWFRNRWMAQSDGLATEYHIL